MSIDPRPLRIWLPTIRAGSGADVFVERLAAGLARAGHEPIVQWFDHRYELLPWRLNSFEAPECTDVVHANSWTGFAFKRKGIPLVVTEHQYVTHPAFRPYQGWLQGIYHRWFIESCMRRSYRAADTVVAVSDFCATAMRKNLDKPVRVIHNWVDTDRFSPYSQGQRMARLQGPIRLLFIGNPSRWKGADILPRLAVKLGSAYEVLCLGGLRKSFVHKTLPANMKILPPVTNNAMPEIYRSADIALVPTRYEAFGYIALEAMACGLPVIGFDSSGTAEVCTQAETALLAPVDDVDELANSARLLASSSLRLKMGSAGRLRVLEYFGEHKAINKYVETYVDAHRFS